MNIARIIWRGITVMAMAALCAGVAAPAHADYESSLKAYWDMDNVWSDSTSNANNGTGYGVTFTSGKFSQGGSFDGTNDFVRVAASSSVSLTSDFTFSAWVNYPSSGGHVIFAKRPTTNSGNYILGVSGGRINLQWLNPSGTARNLYSATSGVPYNSWVNVAVVHNNSANTITFYVNGVQSGNVQATPAEFLANSGDLTIGAQNDASQNGWFNGSLDDVAIWSRALSAAEINIIGSGSGNTVEAFENGVWYGSTSGSWDTAVRWQTGVGPTASKDVYVNSGAAITVNTAGDACNDLYLGYANGESGMLSLTAGDLTAANEYIGRTGTGSVTQTGGTNTIADTLYIGQNSGSAGTYNLQGGILKANAITLGSGASSFNFTGGTLKIYTFTGDLVIGANAEIAPGSSPGIADVYGDFVLNGTYQAELGGLTPGTEYDQIVAHGGNITLGADSIIELAQWSSFVPEIGDNFVLMDWDEGYTFTDNGYEFDPGPYGLPGEWTLSVNGTQFEARYVGAVPEPGCAFGLLVGFFVPGFRRLLKRRVKGQGSRKKR